MLTGRVVVGVLLITASVAFAATLDDFKEAVQHKGCDSIPYESLRDTCKDKAAVRDDYCKSRVSSCKDLDPSDLQKQIDNINDKIKDLKAQRDSLKDKRSDAKDDDERKQIEDQISAIEDQIDKLEKKVDEMQNRLDKEKQQISDRIDVGERCVDAREAVQKAFAETKSNTQSESDEQIKPLAEQLIRYWESEESNHQTEIDKAKEVRDRCKSLR